MTTVTRGTTQPPATTITEEPTSTTSNAIDDLALLRADLQDSMRQSHIDPRKLSAFQRILLTTDGTVTEILEAQFCEAIRINKLAQSQHVISEPIPALEIEAGTRVLLRKIFLRGKCSHQNYIHAHSVIVPARLNDSVRTALLDTDKPIGQLILETRMETFREILTCKMERYPALCTSFAVPEDALFISRTYRVLHQRKPIMLITECFPETSFMEQQLNPPT